ncbi:hypothetical protein [Romboutsia sp. 1001216sp1]|uniref:hypothetical protein n=1 Tax=Romboutsia sp. 1001216sp1 TaxID=2986997 RepID=UPI00232F9D1D|nr:hypothetical protein [Romboutsia sp. 1001216sp1]MDB8804995.1 hypothetical protein [Romboutsia sp. 1001216sp1]MDB8807985.1 hypothetical protein [Romboutsia sp. 1001216sp1]MDB8810640.1 hypothetical protein [Romboutsia sp. 1001216sp1]MDB8816360.1 hypothetical protein [Romboutsia sp. 1001216sp1]MDB8818687.1 hypothetical protein [Romboutsia sp. 1001216sp1]
MFKRNVESIKLSKLIEVKRAEYTVVQLIPTKSNKNNSTHSIANLINKMYMKTSKLIRVENKKLIIETQLKASYYIHVTKKEVQFFFIIPSIHLMKFKSKFTETWKNIEIREVDKLPINLNECTKYQLRYKMNDALSLNVDKRSNDLLNANMSVLEILEENESVGILYNFIPTAEKESNYFKITYKEAIQRYRKGENLKKSKNIVDLGIITLKFLIQFLDDFIGAILSNNKTTQQLFIYTNKEPSPSTIRKAKSDICKTQVVILSKSKEKEREKQLAISTCNTFKSITDDNELVGNEIKQNLNEYTTQLNNVKVLNTTEEELGNCIALPGREIIDTYKVIEHIETKENPVPEELKDGVVNLGVVKYKDNKDCAYLSNEENLQSLPLAIMGGSRSGKSTFSINMCKNIIDAEEGLIVIDFIKNTELSEDIKSITPKNRLIEIDLSNPKHVQSLAYNELKIKEGMNKDVILKIARRQANFILQLVNIMNGDDKQLAPKMRKYLGAAARIAFCNTNTSFKDILRILQNHIYRHDYINNLTEELKVDLEDSILALNELDEYSKVTKDSPISKVCGTKDNKIEGIIDRIDLLRENLVLDSMLSKDPKDNINFIEAMEEGKVVLIRMRDTDFDDDISIDILTTFFIQKIWIATKERGTMHDLPRRCTVLIDEIFQSPTSQKILTKTFVQSAKFGLKYVLTLHYMDQLTKDAQAALKNSNASYMLISGVDKKAYEALEEEFNVHGYSLDDLLNLKQYHSLNLIKSKDSYKSFITHLPPKLKVKDEEQNIA